MTSNDVREVLRREAGRSIYAWAKANKISLAYAYDFVRGAKEPGDKILSALGLERRISYEYKQTKGEKNA